MSARHVIIPLVSAASFLACGGKAPASASASASASTEPKPEPTVVASEMSPQGDPRCLDQLADATVHQVELEFKKPTRAPDAWQITWANSQHDSFDDGRTHQWEEIVFQQVDASGEATPSALTWRPSFTAHPPWDFLPTSVCARLLPDSTTGRLRIEMFRHVLKRGE